MSKLKEESSSSKEGPETSAPGEGLRSREDRVPCRPEMDDRLGVRNASRLVLPVKTPGDEPDAMGLEIAVLPGEDGRGDCPGGNVGGWGDGDREGRGVAPGVALNVNCVLDGV